MAEEKNFENRVKDYLTEYGCWWIKYWGGAAYTRKGVPDLLVSSDGCFLGIELKAGSGEPSMLQLCNLRKIRRSGGYGILLYPGDFEPFKRFNEHKDCAASAAWYLTNIRLQEEWQEKLKKRG